jgi:endonuclease/exonuclease/phosphatase family metal-dependent hydrolase
VNADVIALEEVESDVALRWFRDTYLRDMGYASVASLDAGYYRGVEQSVLSRYEIVEAKVWPNLSITDVRRSGDGWQDVPADKRSSLTFQRSPLMVTVRVRPDYLLTLFVVHHKAGGSGLKYHREAEALKIVELARAVMREDPSRNVAILGDFNAAPWDKSMRVYLEAGFVDTLAHRTTWKDDPEMPLFKTHESDRVLDYILLNSAAYREFVPGSAHVYGTLTPPSSYDYRTDPQPEGYASDHYPVIIELMPHDLK